jgi:hypothetical protein
MSSRATNLAGKVFGRLTVVDRAPGPAGIAVWNCVCACGDSAQVRSVHLTTGNTTSCGCAFRSRMKDLTGRRYGRLLVLARADADSRGRTQWTCRCDCGAEGVFASGALNSGSRKSCGCLLAETREIHWEKQRKAKQARLALGMKRCNDCQNILPLDMFSHSKDQRSHPSGHVGICKGCSRERYVRRKYGMSQQEYSALLAAQGGGCAICGGLFAGGSRRNLNIDHDHATGRVRGILCAHCNKGLGLFRDRYDLLQKAIDYLGGHSPGVRNAG